METKDTVRKFRSRQTPDVPASCRAVSGFALTAISSGLPPKGKTGLTQVTAKIVDYYICMRVIFLLALWGCLLGQPITATASSDEKILRILNWSDYIQIDDEANEALPIVERSPILKSFAEQYGCEIIYHEYEDSGEGRAVLGSTPGYFDLFCLSHVDAPKLGHLGLLDPIDHTKIQTAESDIDPKDFPGLPSQFTYGVPYLVGTTGIVYRKDLVASPPRTWNEYFNPPDDGHKIGILSDPEVVFAFLLRAVGCDFNSSNLADYEKAASQLFDLVNKERIGLVSTDIDECLEALSDGSVSMSIHYSGDVFSMIEENPNLAYYIPEDGGEVYVDLWAVPSGSAHRELAYAFIEFISQPKVSAENSNYLGYVTPFSRARAIASKLDPELLDNPTIHPSADIRKKLFPIRGEPELAGMFWRRVFP